jgi:LmbE family N-acetylglucosaminyl deacetylase
MTARSDLAEGSVLVVSPHLDDAVLSTAGLLIRRGRPATVVTVFAGAPAAGEPVSDWDRLCGFDDARVAAGVRADEDRRACAHLELSAVHLDHVEGGHGDCDLADLRHLLTTVPGGTTVLVPAGIGGHRDHIRVRDAALAALADGGPGPVHLYADLPYAANLWHWGQPAHSDRLCGPAALRAIAALPEAPAQAVLDWVRLTAAEWARKRRAVWAYASQLGCLSLTTRSLMAYPGPLQTEATWRIR